MEPLRIAQIAPLIERVPPERYGGTERVVYHLTEELVRRGHNVTLFATGDSVTSARLVSLVDKGLRLGGREFSCFHCTMSELTRAYKEMAGAFDVMHSHLEYMTFPFAASSRIPTVMTFHGRLDNPDIVRLMRQYRQLHFVSISNAQRLPVADVPWAGTVYHGYPLADFSYQPDAGDYFAYLGRISPEKAPDEAIRIAIDADVPLKIAAKVDPVDREYFNEVVRPLMQHPLIEYVGEVGEHDKIELLQHARALLNPINWPEPFGLVMIEALACGTPVIVRDCGSAPEIITHGRDGFVCHEHKGFVEAVRRIDEIERFQCRQTFESRFTVAHMVAGYERIYERLLYGNQVQKVGVLPPGLEQGIRRVSSR